MDSGAGNSWMADFGAAVSWIGWWEFHRLDGGVSWIGHSEFHGLEVRFFKDKRFGFSWIGYKLFKDDRIVRFLKVRGGVFPTFQRSASINSKPRRGLCNPEIRLFYIYMIIYLLSMIYDIVSTKGSPLRPPLLDKKD
jgi:hypothetical protein